MSALSDFPVHSPRTVSVPNLDMVIVDNRAIGVWTTYGFAGDDVVGFEVMMLARDATYRLVGPHGNQADAPLVRIWENERLVSETMFDVSAEDFGMSGVARVALGDLDRPTRLQFQFQEYGFDESRSIGEELWRAIADARRSISFFRCFDGDAG